MLIQLSSSWYCGACFHLRLHNQSISFLRTYELEGFIIFLSCCERCICCWGGISSWKNIRIYFYFYCGLKLELTIAGDIYSLQFPGARPERRSDRWREADTICKHVYLQRPLWYPGPGLDKPSCSKVRENLLLFHCFWDKIWLRTYRTTAGFAWLTGC